MASSSVGEDRSEKQQASYVCQRCSLPLRLDESLSSLSEHISAELNLPIHSNPDVDLESQATSFDNYVAPCKLTDSGNGFMLISSENELEPMSHQYKVKAALFDTLSGKSNIDHPICDECTDYLIEILEQNIKDAQNDFDDYNKYYNMLKNDTSEAKLSELEKELEEKKSEANRYLEELEALDKEEVELLKEIEEHKLAARRLESERVVFYKAYTKHQKHFAQAKQESLSLSCQHEYTKMQINKLKGTNVFNATFHIWHKGHFGTINNFCLGRLPSAPVDWSEINAAWGQSALLLSGLARKVNLVFKRFKLVPYGNHSYVEVIGDHKEYPLYGSGGFKFMWDTKFDNGMVAFLDCMQQFQEKVNELEKNSAQKRSSFCFPYRINRGKIEDNESSYSIKIQLNSEEQWTKALKFMLTNLKWGLAWMRSQIDDQLEENMEVGQ